MSCRVIGRALLLASTPFKVKTANTLLRSLQGPAVAWLSLTDNAANDSTRVDAHTQLNRLASVWVDMRGSLAQHVTCKRKDGPCMDGRVVSACILVHGWEAFGVLLNQAACHHLPACMHTRPFGCCGALNQKSPYCKVLHAPIHHSMCCLLHMYTTCYTNVAMASLRCCSVQRYLRPWP